VATSLGVTSADARTAASLTIRSGSLGSFSARCIGGGRFSHSATHSLKNSLSLKAGVYMLC